MIFFFQVTDWVDPSFDDFSENTSISAITATSLSVNNSSYRRKSVPSTLESNTFPTRKRGTLSSSEQIYALENSKKYLSENEPWVDKYKPETQVLSSTQTYFYFRKEKDVHFWAIIHKILLNELEKTNNFRVFILYPKTQSFLNSYSEVVPLVVLV